MRGREESQVWRRGALAESSPPRTGPEGSGAAICQSSRDRLRRKRGVLCQNRCKTSLDCLAERSEEGSCPHILVYPHGR